MRRKLFYPVIVCLLLLAYPHEQLKAQIESQVNSGRSPRVHYRHPPKHTNRYVENNRMKKKFRASRKIGGTWDCHIFLYYKSKPQKEREKQIKRKRRKL